MLNPNAMPAILEDVTTALSVLYILDTNIEVKKTINHVFIE